MEQNELHTEMQKPENLGKLWRAPYADLFNAMEELSIRIKTTGTVQQPSLESIRKAFVQNVEGHLHALLMIISYDPKMYNGIKEIYRAWEADIKRISQAEVGQMFSDDLAAVKKTRQLKRASK